MDIIELRHKLHRIPELAFQEFKTKALVEECIKEILEKQSKQIWKLHHFQNSPGLLLEYTITNEPYILFRADMDGLPVWEKTGVDYTSEHSGLMHACGHDVHLSILLGLIQSVASSLPKRNLLFLFSRQKKVKVELKVFLRKVFCKSLKLILLSLYI